MFDTLEQIQNQLRAGEDGRAEFKEVRFSDRGVVSPNTEELAGELVAFANAEGGVPGARPRGDRSRADLRQGFQIRGWPGLFQESRII